MKKKKVLIIDDDSRNIFALSATLKSKGFDCVSSSDARQALHMLDADPGIDLVLTDMMMPEMDGYQTIDAIRKNDKTREMPVIAVTAQAMPGDRQKCLDAGADDYISKPIDVDRLLQLLGQYLAS